MLRAVHGNRVESLLDALLGALPPADPFAPTTVVVGSHLVARWLTREIAIGRGIAAGLELVTFDSFVENAWAGDDAAKAARLVALDKAQLAASIASVLADDELIATVGPVKRYLEAAPEPGDRAAPRRVQLAEQIAAVAWNYALTRPTWMPALLAGHVPEDLEANATPQLRATAQWQATILGAAMRTAGCNDELCSPVPTLPWARRRAQLPPPKLDRPVFVFGVSFLLRSQLEAISDVAQTTDVTVYLLDPCAELWDDVSGRAKAKDGVGMGATVGVGGAPGISADPLPLALWGRAMRDTLGALVERAGGDIDNAFDDSSSSARGMATNAREALLHDVLHRQAPSTTVAERGVEIFACPDPRREIEIVAAEIRARLDADPTLHAREIGVWIASHAERYLAQAKAAFEAVSVPCHLIDAPIDDRGRIGEAVLALLELPTGAMARRDLLRVMTHPAILAAHPHVDAQDWVRWTEKLGIVHGADATAHRLTYLAAHPGRFHWDQGVQRLALGAFMIGGTQTPGLHDRGAVRIGGIDVAPEEVRPEQHASAATYALLVRSLCSDSAWLAQHEATLTEWATIFVGLVDAYIARPSDEASRDVERVRAMLAGLAHIDLDRRRVGFREAREHAARRLVTARANRGEPLAAGVMLAPLQAMRALPFRHVFIVGLDEGAFPASDHPNTLDIRTDSRAGDVSPRDRDRHAFFEALLGARDGLYLSYVAVEAKSGQALGPSSVVLELADALAPYLDTSGSQDTRMTPASAMTGRAALEALTTRFPLHRFAQDTSIPPAVQRERWAVRVRDALHAHLRAKGHPVPDEDGMLALLADPHLAQLRAALGIVEAPVVVPSAPPLRPLSLANVRKFLEAPVQAWAQAVLGLDEVPDEENVEHSDEPFHVERPLRALLLREVLAAQLRDPGASAEERYKAVVRDLELRGQFPVGVFGDAARAADLRVLEQWRAELGPIGVGDVRRLAFGRSSSPLAELMPALELALPGGRTVRLVGQTELLVRRGDRYASVIPLIGKADKRSRHHLRGALDHVVLAAAGLTTGAHDHLLLDAEGMVRAVTHAPWSQADARAYLTDIVTELLDEPHGYLLPFDHLIHGYAGKPAGRIHGDAITTLLGFGPIDRIDGLVAPPNPGELANKRLGPLVTRMTGDHSLGGGES